MAEVHENVVSRAAAVDESELTKVRGGAVALPESRLAPVRSVTSAFDFMPRDLAQALELAGALSDSDMVPKQYQGKPGNVLVAIQWGAELDMKPLQAMANIAVINGKPSLYGDAGKALLIAKGCQIEEWDTGRIQAEEKAVCIVRRAGHRDVSRTFSVEDAKRAKLWNKEGPWSTYPWRQMAWRAFWFAARDAAADILKGMAGAEEMADVPGERDITAEAGPAETTARTSRSESVRDRLIKDRVTVEQVIKAFDDANDLEAVNKAVDLARSLKTDEDKLGASVAYRRCVERLKEAAQQTQRQVQGELKQEANKAAGPTIEEVRKALAKAIKKKDLAALDDAGSLIEQLEASDDIKAALKADYASGKAELAPKE